MLKIFLSLLMVISVLSIGILPKIIIKSVPTVTYVKPKIDFYSTKVSCTGTVDFKDSYEMYVQTPIITTDIGFSVGDYILKGDVIASVDSQTTLAVVSNQSGSNISESDEEAILSAASLYGISAENVRKLRELGGLDKYIESSINEKQNDIYIPEKIISPVEGIISEINIKNNVLSSNTKPVITIGNPNSLKVIASVNESLIQQVKVGDKVVITGNGFKGKSYEGVVIKKHPKARKNLVGNVYEAVVDVEIDIYNPDTIIYPGFSAMVDIIVEDEKERMMLPYNCIYQDENNDEYALIYENGEITKKHIMTGKEYLYEVEILQGIGINDIVVHNLDSRILNKSNQSNKVLLKGEVEDDTRKYSTQP
ncbi:MAG: efflux RND transporter periplasmic adaptor subunit [Oscillospiraceae bacterium]